MAIPAQVQVLRLACSPSPQQLPTHINFNLSGILINKVTHHRVAQLKQLLPCSGTRDWSFIDSHTLSIDQPHHMPRQAPNKHHMSMPMACGTKANKPHARQPPCSQTVLISGSLAARSVVPQHVQVHLVMTVLSSLAAAGLPQGSAAGGSIHQGGCTSAPAKQREAVWLVSHQSAALLA